jgi:hypothetical protein
LLSGSGYYRWPLSTAHRFGNRTNPVLPAGRRTISKRHWLGAAVSIHALSA